MKKRQFFALAVVLTASFFLSKVSESKISLLVIAFAFQFVVASYLSLVVHQTDLQPYIVKPVKFNDWIVGVFALFAISIFLGGYFGTSADFIPFFASAFGLLAGILVGGIIAHKLEGKKITNWILFKFESKFIF